MSICPEDRFAIIRCELLKSITIKYIMVTSQPRSHLEDQAIKDYTRTVDRIMAELEALDKAGVLDDLAEFLAVTYGGPK